MAPGGCDPHPHPTKEFLVAKRTLLRTLALVALVAVALGLVHAAPNVRAATTSTGNGAPSGPHFELNLHGVASGQGFTASGTSNNIWAPLTGKCSINLQEGTSFGVLNPNCVTSDALFQLPNPCSYLTCTTLAYSV